MARPVFAGRAFTYVFRSVLGAFLLFNQATATRAVRGRVRLPPGWDRDRPDARSSISVATNNKIGSAASLPAVRPYTDDSKMIGNANDYSYRNFQTHDVLVLICVAISTTIYVYMLGDGRVATKTEKAILETNELRTSCRSFIVAMNEDLHAMTESEKELGKVNLDAYREGFRMFLTSVYAKPECIVGATEDAGVFVLFKRFVRQWLDAFSECSTDPLKQPRRIVSKSEVDQCCSITQLIDLLLRDHHAGLHSPVFTAGMDMIAPKVGQFDKMLQPQTCEKPSVQAFTLNNVVRAFFIIALVTQGVFMTIEIRDAQWFHVGALGFSFILMLVVLLRFAHVLELDRLRLVLDHVRRETREVQQHHKDLGAICSNTKMCLNMWTGRTCPRLEVYRMLQEVMLSSGSPALSLVLEATLDNISSFERSMGSLSSWYGKDALSEGTLAFVSEQIKAAKGIILEPRHDLARNLPGITFRMRNVVSVVGVQNISVNFDSSNAYARARVGNGTWCCTDTRNMHVPWESFGFFFAPTLGDKEVIVEVVDHDKDESIAYGLASFCDLEVGKWQTVVLEMKGPRGSSLQVDLFHATDLAHLAELHQVDFDHLSQHCVYRHPPTPQ